MYKLIRDNIPAIMQERNQICNYATIKNTELYKKLLIAKLDEEVKEYLECFSTEELADVLTVVNALIALEDPAVFTQTYKDKLDKNGGFDKKYIGFFE